MEGKEVATQTRIMLVEDQPDFRRLMVALLARQPDLEVVAEAGSLTEARKHATTASFDVAVLDLGLPDGNGVELISDLRGSNPEAAVLILSASLDPASLDKARQLGVEEMMDKLSPMPEVLDAIRRLGGA